MKNYSNQPRKPMMYGGAATTPKKRKKMQSGGAAMANAETQSRLATGRATAEDQQLAQKQRREELMRKSIPELRKIAAGKGADAMMARSVLREKGDEGAMPPGDQQPAGMMYGGKMKKK